MPHPELQYGHRPHHQPHATQLNGLAAIPRSHLTATPPSGSMDAVPLSLQIQDPSQPRIAGANHPLQPQQQPLEVLFRKTRDPYRDGGDQLGYRQHHEMPPAARQDAVSGNLPLRPRRDQSPGLERPRGRSPSAQIRPPNTATAPPLLVHPSSDQIQGAYAASSAAGHGLRAASQSSNEVRSAHRPSGTDQPRKRRSWLSGGNSRLRSKSHTSFAGTESPAWVLSRDSRADYNVDCLLNCEKVPELWDDNGTLYVYLSPYHSDKGPSFKVPSSVIEQSRVLSGQVQSQLSSPISPRSRARSFGGRDTLMAADAHRIAQPASPPPSIGSEARLYLPVERRGSNGASSDLDRLVSLRNLFALLTGQPLVATRTFPTAFAALTQVARLLREFEFGATSGGSSSFGEAADVSIGFYVDQTGLVDVRFSLDKTLEALVLGEQLRFWPLYNEAFCHAVGKYSALRERKSPLWDKISPSTLQRLERAHLDLLTRQHSVNTRLEQFEFPSLFSGVGNSTSNPDYRNLRFKNWRSSFSDMRSFALKYYKNQFGSWPPKASSKRNPFSESGLNRLVLKILYADLCSVYDLLADRGSITTRVGEDGLVSGVSASPATAASAHCHTSDPTIMALRQILAEFDTSSPPVLPPIPFDVPKLPSMASVHGQFPEMAPKDQARFEKNIQPHDLQQLLLKSHNKDAERGAESPFLAAFEAFEHREAARGKSETELAEMRIGHWLFLYVVLQSIPMLVIDAPGLCFSEGTEYFLCEPPQGHPPWVEDAGEVRKAWFQTAGGAGPLVELSADVLLYSVEATHHRSHCWLAAKKWDSEAGLGSARGAKGAFSVQPAAVPAAAHVAPGMDSHWPFDPAADLVPSTTAPSSGVPSAFDETTAPRSRSTSPRTDAQWQGRASPTPPLQQGSAEEQQQRVRLRHASIGWTLEPVGLASDAVRTGSDSLAVGHDSRRVVSVNNLRALGDAAGHAGYGPSGTVGVGSGASVSSSSAAGEFFNAESTFDSILSSMDDGRKKKKRSSFLPF